MIIPEKIKINSINIIKAQLAPDEGFLESPIKPHSFRFGLGKEIAHHPEEGRYRYRLFFNLTGLNEAEQEIGLSLDYGIEFHFSVENFRDFIKEEEDGSVKLNADLGATLLGMAYSTARGIVFERTRGTFFDGVILPVLDPYKALLGEKG